MKIAFIGYSGHAYVCIDIALMLGYEVVGYYDLTEKDYNPFGLKYLGKEEKPNSDILLFPALGDNLIRNKIFFNFNEYIRLNIIHPNAFISNKSLLGNGILICSGSSINAFAKIGDGCIINTGAVVEHECIIGDFCHLAPGSVLAGNVEIGKNTFIGANSVVKQGIKIGDNVVIGAGSVVLKDVENGKILVGNPAKELNKK